MLPNETLDGPARGRYNSLVQKRDDVLKRARASSALTLPALIPSEGYTESSTLPTPHQGVGARGVNNLSSKLLLSLASATAPFFRMKVDPKARERLADDPKFKTQIEKALGSFERIIMDDIEVTGDRVALFEALKHLIVAGNVLLYDTKIGLKLFHLDKYVVRRDPMGQVIEIVVQEKFEPETLPD